MTRNSETTMKETLYVQGLGPWRSTRLNTMTSGVESPSWGTTMTTTLVAATSTTIDEPTTHGEQATSQQ